MMHRSLLALALLGALTAAGCSSSDQAANDVAATSAPTDAMAGDAMAADAQADAMADDAMAADSMAGKDMAADLAPARYQVTFASRWTEKDHPFEYPSPKYVGLSVAHFSPLIGASHGPGYALFSEGAMPSAGLEHLSETGKHDPLDAEIKAAITTGQALSLVEAAEPLKDHSKTEMAEVAVDGKHPNVSLVAMIAPSPDWFAGARDVSLVENGQWVAERTIELFPYDSGGDAGTTYRADDADLAPKHPVSTLAGDPHFTVDGKLLPVATVTFKKL
jgi:hypothetical protein